MESAYDQMESVQVRIKRLEQRLIFWQITVLSLALMVVGGFALRAEAQSPTQFRAPFQILSTDGKRVLFTFFEWQRPGAPAPGAALAFYEKNVPFAYLTATGDTYKNPTDPSDKFLNELKIYLAEYPAQDTTKMAQWFEVSSLALTSGGGSLVLLNRPGTPTSQPTHAARLTAKDGDGRLIMYMKDGKTETFPKQ